MTPEQTLIEKAAVPEFFAKVAAETGVSPHDAAAARDLRVLGDRVAAGVELFLHKAAAARTARGDDLIKGAAAAADLAAGIVPAPPAQTPTDPTKVAADLETYEAALAVLKAAADVGMTPEMVGEKTEEEEEAEKAAQKDKDLAAAGGTV